MKALRWLTRVGPAFVIAAVVLGPGSLTTSTKMGWFYGYRMLWLLVLLGVLMAGFVTLFMRFGIGSNKSFLQHCADTWGRWFAALCGFSMFYICTAFQFSNNIGVTTAMNSLITPVSKLASKETVGIAPWVWPVVFNALALLFLFGFRKVYAILEKAMTALVVVMLAAFLINLAYVRPDLAGVARGLVPSIPKGLDWGLTAGLVATTFSIVGAIFATYLVRARGWKQDDYGKGVADSISGIAMLALISMVVMVTAATVLHGRQGVKITNAADMAVPLYNLLGSASKVVFCIGFAAAAFSSFLVNAMIGGTLLSDGFGLNEDINSMPAKVSSAASLIIGMVVAILVTQLRTVEFADAIVLAQAGTLLAIPLAIIASLLVLFRPRGTGARPMNLASKIFVVLGAAVLGVVAARSYPIILSKVSTMLGAG